MTRDRVSTLDGLRGVAILLVIARHLAFSYEPLGENTRRWLVAFANAGVGVRLFFALSGYLITSILVRELTATGDISLRNFYWRRALRLFPAFYVYLFALVLIDGFVPVGVNPSTFASAATFTWNYSYLWRTDSPEGFWNFGHLWTLALEQQFYLVWPAVLVFLGARRALWAALALVAWCPLARVATYFLFPAQRGFVGAMFHTGVDILMVGCAAALLLQRAPAREFLRRHGPAGAAAATLWLLVGSALTSEFLHGFPAACGLTLDALAATWLVAWVHHFAPPTLQSFLGRGPLRAIGLVSYSLYLWQQLILSREGPLRDGHIFGALALAGLAAVASYKFIEQPALRLKNFSLRPALSA